MGEEVIQTEVDKLINVLKTKKKVELKKLAEEIKVPEPTVQQWIDFLVEEKIVSVDYDFTKPIISIIEEPKETKKESKEDIIKYKQNFKKTTSKKNKNSEFLWKQHVLENLDILKQFFYTEAEKRKLENINELWEEYKKKVTSI